ncbi:hypothetical protein [Phascolarctobacterium succinatutens]|uniref:hypothetical protein n=1 Tax=Phascolarctobacterium succinatutens TaxID=626940 RepID=UPI0004012429|nr:hypothetical protein [Phascolarctobacterium succinatutens]
MNSRTDKDLKRIMGAIRCDTLEEKAEKEKCAGVIERMNQRYETAMRFMKRRK